MPVPQSTRVRVLLVSEDDSGSSIQGETLHQECVLVADEVSGGYANAGVHQYQGVVGL